MITKWTDESVNQYQIFGQLIYHKTSQWTSQTIIDQSIDEFIDQFPETGVPWETNLNYFHQYDLKNKFTSTKISSVTELVLHSHKRKSLASRIKW